MIVGLSSSNGLIRGYKLPFLQYDTSRKLNEAQDIKNRNSSKTITVYILTTTTREHKYVKILR